MKKSSLIILSLFLSITIWAQSETRDLSSFSSVSVGESIDLILKKGSKESAKITVDDIPLDEVITDISGNSLKIYLEGNSYRNVDVTIVLTYVSLEGIKSSSSSSIRAEGEITAKGNFEIKCSSSGNITAEVIAESIEIDVSSSGDVDLVVDTDEMEIEVSSSGDIDIRGRAGSIEASASSSGSIDGYELICGDADLRTSSSASIKLTINGDLEARASSGSSIRYKGSTKRVDVDSSSGASIKRS